MRTGRMPEDLAQMGRSTHEDATAHKTEVELDAE